MSQESAVRFEQQIDFIAGAALDTDIVGSDSDTGVTEFSPLRANRLLDVVHDVNPAAATIFFTLFIRRLNLSRNRIGVTANFDTAFNGRIRPNMPKNVRAGFFQWVEQQNGGALSAQSYLVTFAQPLAV